MRRIGLYTQVAAASLGFTACISSPEQPPAGDSLLSFQGSIDVQGSQVEAVGVAVAFATDPGNALHIVSADTEGSFPAGFRASLDAAPPEAALQRMQDGEPLFAYGYLTAVPANHVGSILIANSRSGSGGCNASACIEEEEWCSQTNDPADDVCYSEITTCDLNHQNCNVVAEGDVSLKTGPWDRLAGLSTNYLVLYLRSAARANTFTSLTFADGSALPAGYHLLAVSDRSEQELEAVSACFASAEQTALARYNQKHGTTLEDPSQLPREGEDEFDGYFYAAQLELRCAQTDKRYTPIADPGKQAIAVQLSRDEDALSL